MQQNDLKGASLYYLVNLDPERDVKADVHIPKQVDSNKSACLDFTLEIDPRDKRDKVMRP
ncbi:hypothetical protein GCM10020370_32380 [Paenibacillus hodogayensis]